MTGPTEALGGEWEDRGVRGGAVVVVNHASHRLAERALAPLQGLGALLVVVDSWSSPQEREALTRASAQHGWLLVTPARNDGFAAGVNAGVAAARAQGRTSFLLLNPDAEAGADVVRSLLEHSQREPWSLVSPVVVRRDGTTESRGAFLDLCSGRTRGRYDLPGGPAAAPSQEDLAAKEHPGRLAWLPGTCLAVHSAVLDRLGGLDEGYFLYWEDIDLSVRARQTGASLVVRHDLRVVHEEGGTQSRRAGGRSSLYYDRVCRNRLRFGVEHLSRRQLLTWVLQTPAECREVLLRAGRRNVLQDPVLVLAAARGTVAGLVLATTALLRGSRVIGRRAPLAPAPPLVARRSSSLVVAVPTFRRPEALRHLLPQLQQQVDDVLAVGAGVERAEVVVIDNDPDQTARAVVDELRLPSVRGVHEPAPGLASARNRALDESSGADLLLFFDDDERPAPGCFRHLLATLADSSASAVAGAVVSELPPSASGWAVASGLFDRPRHRTGTSLVAARTGNLLLDVAVVRRLGLRFDSAYGTTGGEDTVFTSALVAAGGRLVWCDEAIAVDDVPSHRATARWVLRRAMSAGTTSGRVAVAGAGRIRRTAVALGGAVRVAAGLVSCSAGVVRRHRAQRARGAVLAARGAGVVLAAAGVARQEYRR